MITIYHNPRCSKSRETLTIVEAFAARNGLRVDVVEYLKTPPSTEQLTGILRMLGCGADGIIRSNEEEFARLGLQNAGDDELLRAIATHPALLQRPIVVQDGRAAIGRPPDKVLNILRAD